MNKLVFGYVYVLIYRVRHNKNHIIVYQKTHNKVLKHVSNNVVHPVVEEL